MDISSVIDGIASGAAANIKVNEGDYTGKDGLLYCGKCHTPKQTEIGVDGSGSIRRVMCLCQCETDKVRKEKDAQKQAEFDRRNKCGYGHLPTTICKTAALLRRCAIM